MVVTLSLVVSLALAQKVEIIRGGKGKAKRPAAAAKPETDARQQALEEEEKRLAERQRALEAKEQQLTEKDQALEEKSQELEKKDEASKSEKEKEKKAAEAQRQSMEKMSSDNAAAMNDLSRALGGN
jgi:ribonuclease Y